MLDENNADGQYLALAWPEAGGEHLTGARFVAFSAGSVDGRARRPHCITYTAFFRNFSLELIKNFLHLKHSIKTPTQFRHSLAQRDDLPHRVENLVCHLQQLLLSSEHTFTIVLQQGAV